MSKKFSKLNSGLTNTNIIHVVRLKIEFRSARKSR